MKTYLIKILGATITFQMYKGFLDNANEDKPGICSHELDNCRHPQWVKANALVCLIGIKKNKMELFSNY